MCSIFFLLCCNWGEVKTENLQYFYRLVFSPVCSKLGRSHANVISPTTNLSVGTSFAALRVVVLATEFTIVLLIYALVLLEVSISIQSKYEGFPPLAISPLEESNSFR